MSYLPKRDGPLLNWSSNFHQLVSANFALYGLTQQQSDSYAAAHQSYLSAFQAATHPPTRTTPSILAKNTAKKALTALARELVKIIQAAPGTTDEMRGALAITVPDVEPTPWPMPSYPPIIEIVSTLGRIVRIRLKDAQSPDSRAKPQYVKGATILTYVGTLPPAPSDIGAWKFEGNTSTTTFQIEFPPTVPSGQTVWITSFWFNPRMQTGPSAPPIYVQIPGTIQQEAA